MQTIDKFQQECFVWSVETFGVRPPRGPLNHLKSECDEMIATPNDVTEFADGYLLLMDGASRAGHKMSEVFDAAIAKHEINTKREWGEQNEQGFTEHVRTFPEDEPDFDPDCRQ